METSLTVGPQPQRGLQDVPAEILRDIIRYLVTPSPYSPRLEPSVLRVSKCFHTIGHEILYDNVHFSPSELGESGSWSTFAQKFDRRARQLTVDIDGLTLEGAAQRLHDVVESLESRIRSNVLRIALSGRANETHLVLDMHAVISSVKDLFSRLNPDTYELAIKLIIEDDHESPPLPDSIRWGLSSAMLSLKRLHLRLPCTYPDCYSPLQLTQPCPDLEEIVVIFNAMPYNHPATRAAPIARDTWLTLVGARENAHLPRLQRGFVMCPVFAEPGSEPEINWNPWSELDLRSLCRIQDRIDLYDIMTAKMRELPLVPILWRSDNDVGCRSLAPELLWTRSEWRETSYFDHMASYWFQMPVSVERRKRHPEEFSHYSTTTEPDDGYQASMVTSLGRISAVILESIWIADPDTGSEISLDKSYRRDGFDEEYHQPLFANASFQNLDPRKLQFVKNQILGNSKPLHIPMVSAADIRQYYDSSQLKREYISP